MCPSMGPSNIVWCLGWSWTSACFSTERKWTGRGQAYPGEAGERDHCRPTKACYWLCVCVAAVGSEHQGLNGSEDVFGLDHRADRSVADSALRYVLFY